MTFSYSYKDSGGARHEGKIEAPGRDEAFAALRRQGIRPIRVEAPAGASVGGGKGWLTVGAVVLGAGCLVLGAVLWQTARGLGNGVSGELGPVAAEDARPTRSDMGGYPRQEPVGSHKALETRPVELPFSGRVARPRARKPIHGFERFSRQVEDRFAKIFDHPSEAYLARFAQPGVEVPRLPDEEVVDMLGDDMQDALDDPIALLPDDARAVADLKRIVSGLKEEVALLLASGKTPMEVKNWLEGRQRMEADYRRHLVRRLEDGELTSEEANGMLESMGFAPTPSAGEAPRTR